jgi:mannose-6-phosphate isomerase-like protein (cupin superfamily)
VDIPTRTAEDAYFLEPREGQTVWFLSNRITVKATAASTGGAYGLVESLIAPGFSPPLHVHHREDEAFWLLEGDVTMRCGDRTFRAQPGSFVFLPRAVPHTFIVEGDTPARMLTLLSPGGGEEFFVAAGRRPAHDGLPPAAPPDIETLTRVGERFGSEIVGPPMRPTGQTGATSII